jgi:hypothetical protein
MDVQDALQRDNSELSNTVRKLNRDVAKVPKHYSLALWEEFDRFPCVALLVRNNFVAISP